MSYANLDEWFRLDTSKYWFDGSFWKGAVGV